MYVSVLKQVCLEPSEIILLFDLFSGYANTALGIVFSQNDGMDLALCHSCDQVSDCTVLSITFLDLHHDGEDI